jgi:hypothetical protein
MLFRDPEDNVRFCLEFIKERSWEWLVTLKYPAIIKPRCFADAHRNPKDCFTEWIVEFDGKRCVSYARAVEERKNGDVWMHVLIRDYSGIDRYFWRRRWAEISGGSAWDRTLDKGIERLFAYFAYRRDFYIEVCAGWHSVLCYTKESSDW